LMELYTLVRLCNDTIAKSMPAASCCTQSCLTSCTSVSWSQLNTVPKSPCTYSRPSLASSRMPLLLQHTRTNPSRSGNRCVHSSSDPFRLRCTVPLSALMQNIQLPSVSKSVTSRSRQRSSTVLSVARCTPCSSTPFASSRMCVSPRTRSLTPQAGSYPSGCTIDSLPSSLRSQ
uniref:Uncharacterized protein n=1 Tax=Anopheles coluzzii TaxID=1518534 RepID=A0A8W7PID6_ANOCL